MTEQQHCAIAAKINMFPSRWSKDNIKELMWLHNVKFDDIKKLQVCYLISKEDHSVFVIPMFCADDEDAELPGGRQRFFDNDYAWFAFAPTDLMTP